MNPFAKIMKSIGRRFPTVRFEADLAAKPQGASFLNVELEGHLVIIEWHPGHGYGVSADPHPAYGEGPHEVFRSPQATAERVKALLLSRTKTTSPRPLPLTALRKLRRISQVELAKRLGVNQAAISKLEKRNDLRLSTLRSVIAAMKGRLNIRVAFSDGTTREVQLPGGKK